MNKQSERYNYFIIGLVLGLTIAFAVSSSYYEGYKKTTQDNVYHTYYNLNLNETINQISQNCGSTFLTKQFGSDRWSIYKRVCKVDGYCKYEYIDLYDCFSGVQDE